MKGMTLTAVRNSEAPKVYKFLNSAKKVCELLYDISLTGIRKYHYVKHMS